MQNYEKNFHYVRNSIGNRDITKKKKTVTVTTRVVDKKHVFHKFAVLAVNENAETNIANKQIIRTDDWKQWQRTLILGHLFTQLQPLLTKKNR